MDRKESEDINPIKEINYLQELIEKGYIVKGPNSDISKNLFVFKRIIKRDYRFIPESWLESRGYKFVEPSDFTKGYKLAYKEKEGIIQEYYESNYSLYKEGDEIHLYLKCK